MLPDLGRLREKGALPPPRVCVETFPSPGLTPQVFYLLGVRENRPDELAAQVEAQHGMRAELIAERRAQNERLFVMRFSRSQPASA